MQLNIYLFYKGQCETAFKFYEQVLGGKIEAMQPFKESPGGEKMPDDWRSKIMHARLVVDGQILMGADGPPDHPEDNKGFSVSIGIDDPVRAERIFNALKEGGKVKMPFQETFWAVRFGMVVDRFGIPWMINCEKKS